HLAREQAGKMKGREPRHLRQRRHAQRGIEMRLDVAQCALQRRKRGADRNHLVGVACHAPQSAASAGRCLDRACCSYPPPVRRRATIWVVGGGSSPDSRRFLRSLSFDNHPPQPEGSRQRGAAMIVPTITSKLSDLLGCRHPILCAGMGGPARSELAVAVNAAGGFGMLGMVRKSPELIRQEIAETRRHTARPFAVNLIPAGTKPELLRAELDSCFAEKVPALCFFWDVRPDLVAEANAAGCTVLYQVGWPEDAFAAEAAGADVIIAQGV